MARKITVVEVQDRNPWGDESMQDGDAENDSITQTELPGYSNLFREREKAVARGESPGPLPCRIQLARREGFDGRPDRRRVGHWERQGYKIAKLEDLQKFGISLEGSAYKVEVDGSITVTDLVMMICDAKNAAKLHGKMVREQADQLAESERKLQQAAETYNRQHHPNDRTGTKAFTENVPAPTVAKVRKTK